MWTLTRLEAEGIRGINNCVAIDLHPRLTIIYGDNASGKTSIAEAIEWALCGTTQKIEQARRTNRTEELADTLRNLHAGERPTRVRLTFAHTHNSDQVVVERLLNPLSGTSEVSIDGHSTASFLPIRTVPIVLQHGLRSFIETPPSKRWDQVARMLDLDRLEEFKDFIQRVVTLARNHFAGDLSTLRTIETQASAMDLVNLNTAIHNRDLHAVIQAISDAIEHATGEMVPVPQWLERLELWVREIQRRSFPGLFSNDQVPTIEPVTDDQWNSLLMSVTELAEQAIASLARRVDRNAAERIEFLLRGLSLVRKGDPTCPFCEEETLSDERLSQIQQLVSTAEMEAAASKTPGESLSRLSQILDRIQATLPPALPKDEIDRLVSYVPPDVWRAYEHAAHALQEIGLPKVSDLQGLQERLREPSATPELLHATLEELRKLINQARNAYQQLQERVPLYCQAIDRLREHSVAAVDPEQSRSIERIKWAVEQLPQIRKAIRAEALLEQLRGDDQTTADFVRSVVAQRLEDQKSEVLEWYQLLNPSEPVGLHDIRVRGTRTRRVVDLVAKTFGTEAHAAGILSESHLNAVGLAVYLAQYTGPANPTQFIVIDDPVQSLDDDHATRFCLDVLQRILDKGFQVILLTHLVKIAEDVYAKYLQLAPEYLMVFSDSERGLQIRFHRLGSLLRNAEERARLPHPHLRVSAAVLIRVFIDQLCYMMYTQATGEWMPISKRGWTETKERIKLVSQYCPEVEEQHVQTLQYVCNRANEGSHVDEAGTALTTQQWLDLIQRCKTVGRHYFPSEVH